MLLIFLQFEIEASATESCFVIHSAVLLFIWLKQSTEILLPVEQKKSAPDLKLP